MKRLALFAIAMLLALHQAAAAEIPESVHKLYLQGATSVALPSDPVTLPLQGTDWTGHYRSPYVRVFVNGHGPYTFLFDTGSNVTTISTKVLHAAKVDIFNATPGHHEVARARDVRAGGIVMRDYYMVVSDGDDVDGILGFNSFGKNYLTFDFQAKTLRIGSKANELAGSLWLSYSLSHRLPMIDLRIDGKRLPTLIDSGDDAYGWEGSSDQLRGLLFDYPPSAAGTVYNGQTGATKTTVTTVDGTLHLGPMTAERPVVAVNPSLPIPDIGMDVIDQFVLEFDRVHRRVALVPRFLGSQFVVPGQKTCGVYISFAHPARTVKEVIDGWAPARAGVDQGDVVLRIDGRDASSITYEQWDKLQRNARQVTLQWSHGGRASTKTFPIAELR